MEIVKEIPSPDQIKSLRKKYKLTQEVLAMIIHQTRRAIIQYEQGERQMPPSTWRLMKIEIGQELPLFFNEQNEKTTIK